MVLAHLWSDRRTVSMHQASSQVLFPFVELFRICDIGWVVNEVYIYHRLH
jgi:hypothetical protein